MRFPTKTLQWPLLAAVLLGAAMPSFGQILPQRFGKWAPGSCAGQKENAVVPDTPIAAESKLRTAASELYCRGNSGVSVLAYEFADSTGAYEFYTSELKEGMNATTVGGASAVDNQRFLTLLGNYVVAVEPPSNISDPDLVLLLKPIKDRAKETPLPPIRAFLPNEGMVQGTQRYAMGPAAFQSALDSLGHSKFAALTGEINFRIGTEAALAKYAMRGGKTQTLLLLDYPTPQLAEQHLRHLQGVLGAKPEFAGTTVERKGSLLSLVLSPASEAVAADLRNRIDYGTEVTWNEGSHTLTDPPWVVVLKNIFLGTFAFCGLAIVLGLAFGGIRVLTKRVLPGKVFDRPEDMEVLQLGLSGKRIDPRDFY